MPLNSPNVKRYHTITEVSKMLDVKPSLLRFWEKEFVQIQPKTNARGKRAYKAEDIEVIRRIFDLVKVQGLTHEGARRALSARKGEPSERAHHAMEAAKASAMAHDSAISFDQDARQLESLRKNQKEALTKLKSVRQKLLEARAALS
ncbi:MAG: MerR family transcriptional regulator [Bacteroidetes bacterium]|nr:MerR family transcriptional regulator [Bacteroidota bacterium]MDA0903937.1 MerR family transcriptional regulator [Bacteroidota bacterium]MDA1242783.1 MerR family transcriptional regulator [Bacteroidota bacterium]